VLIVRQGQMEALEAHARERFVRVMLAYLEGRFPHHYAELGEPNVRHLVASGITRAEAFGVRAEQDVAGLIHFMFDADPDFDRHPDYGWAVAALRQPGLEPSERVDRLFTEWQARRDGKGGA